MLLVKVVELLPFLRLSEQQGIIFRDHAYIFLGFSVEAEQDFLGMVLLALVFICAVKMDNTDLPCNAEWILSRRVT